jgi:dihydroorotate dehydrogenase (fumarate)
MLKTNYLGLELKNPIVPSSSPLCRNVDTLRQMEDAGAGAVVLHSLFEEEILAESHTLDRYLSTGADSHAEALSYFPEMPASLSNVDVYLDHIRRSKLALDIPVIASLNGVSTGGWVKYARDIEQAGADALELNIYYIPTETDISGAEVEEIYANTLIDVRSATSLPIAIKLSPYFSALPNMCQRLVRTGADGLVMFNRFYQPDLDIILLDVKPNLQLSTSADLRLPLRWIAIMYGNVEADLALTSGVHSVQDVVKGLAAGAKVTMMASELLQNGIIRISEILDGLVDWLLEYEYDNVTQLRGSLSQLNCPAPAAFERANYVNIVKSYGPGTVPHISW